MRIVDRVVCLKDDAEVALVPGLFGENNTDAEGKKSIPHTTCIVIKVSRGKVTLSSDESGH